MYPNTRSKSNKEETEVMSISEEIKTYLNNLIKPLVTNEYIESLFEKLSAKFEEKLKIQDQKIERLNSIVNLKNNIIEKLELKCDDLQQYQRRSSVRLHGIEYV